MDLSCKARKKELTSVIDGVEKMIDQMDQKLKDKLKHGKSLGIEEKSKLHVPNDSHRLIHCGNEENISKVERKGKNNFSEVGVLLKKQRKKNTSVRSVSCTTSLENQSDDYTHKNHTKEKKSNKCKILSPKNINIDTASTVKRRKSSSKKGQSHPTTFQNHNNESHQEECCNIKAKKISKNRVISPKNFGLNVAPTRRKKLQCGYMKSTLNSKLRQKNIADDRRTEIKPLNFVPDGSKGLSHNIGVQTQQCTAQIMYTGDLQASAVMISLAVENAQKEIGKKKLPSC